MDKGTFYGVTAVLLAATLMSSSLAVLYYDSAQAQASDSQKYVHELSVALSKYISLSSSYTTSLQDLGTTLALLADAVGNLNTSSSSYRNASLALSSLWSSYLVLARRNGTAPPIYEVDMIVDFGNGTRHWYNDTSTQPGWNAYIVTLVLLKGEVQATLYHFPGYPPEHFVESLQNVSGTASTSWFVWQFSGGSWQDLPTGADELLIHNGTIFAWTLCAYDSNFNPTCSP